jgi:hypothetical protein
MKITVGDGKYTFVRDDGNYEVRVLRYGEDWLTVERGSNAVMALMYRVQDLEEKLEAAESEICDLNDEMELTGSG